MAKDQVAQKLGLDRDKFSPENSLTEDERKALGTRGLFTKEGPRQAISGSGYGAPPKFFNKNECFATCTNGAVYAPDYYSSSQFVLKCGNRACYQTKWQEGLERFKEKEGKRAKHTDAVRRKLADEVRPVLAERPDLARGLLHILTQNALDGRTTSPLNYNDGAREVAYHARLQQSGLRSL